MENQIKNEKKPTYKKWWFWLIIIMVIIVGGAGNKKNTNISTQTSSSIGTKKEVNIQNENGEGEIGEYYIKVKEHNIIYDTQNKPVLLIKLAFTNNNDEAKSFAYTLDAKAYQNGIELTTPISSYGINGLDWNEKSKEIKQGVTYEFNIGFYIDDINQNVELEISPFISSKYSKKITKTIEL